MSNGQIRINYCVPGLVPHLSAALARGPAWAPATFLYPAIFVPGLATLVPAAHAVQPLAAASDRGLPGLAPEERFELGLISERLRHAGAVSASVGQPDLPAGAALNAGYSAPAALDFSSEALPAFPAEQVRALFVLLAAESAGGLPSHAADSGSSCCAASAAVPPDGDTDLQYTAADRQAAARALEQSHASTGPIRLDAAPIHGPSAHPSGAVHSTATRENTLEAAGSSARGYAG